jgi:hypothetical protein
MLKILASADEARDRRKAPEPGEQANMVSQGMAKLQQLVQQQPSYSSDSSAMESAYYTSDSDDGGKSRGRSKNRQKHPSKTVRRSPSPSTSRSPTPPRRSKSQRRSQSKGDKTEERERNPTKCKYCTKFNGNGFAHAPPKNIPHDKCNFNKKFKGWRPRLAQVGMRQDGHRFQRVGRIR